MKPAVPTDAQRPPTAPCNAIETAADIAGLMTDTDTSGVMTGTDTAGVMTGTDTAGVTTGTVKWFDATRGYGFVVPDAGGPDILIHHKLLASHGCKHLPDGARLTLCAVTGARGQQASRIVSIDSPAIDMARPARPAHGPHINPLDYLAMAGDFEPVEVCWFNRARGYGFLLRGDGVTQIFVHMETVRRAHLATLVAGQCCRARVHDGPRGALAVALEAQAD